MTQTPEKEIEAVATALANAQRTRAGLPWLTTEELKNPAFPWANAMDDARAALSVIHQFADAQGLVRELLQELGPFEMVSGDSYNRTQPGSGLKVNNSASWIVSTAIRSQRRTKELLDKLNTFLGEQR